jgi:hypothetical protein
MLLTLLIVIVLSRALRSHSLSNATRTPSPLASHAAVIAALLENSVFTCFKVGHPCMEQDPGGWLHLSSIPPATYRRTHDVRSVGRGWYGRKGTVDTWYRGRKS